MPITELALCIGGATKAYKMVRACVDAGREIEDTASFFSSFFDKKERITEIEIENKNGPKFLRGNSIEAQALEIQMAKHKTNQMEKELRELICIYGPGEQFYKEMMQTRRRLRAERFARAKAQAQKKRLIIDGMLIAGACVFSVGIIWFTVSIIVGASR
tara:strand:- start:5447 stop:5923 length:477 start_codon:yes stop_codon:yes gene_type:complete